MRILRPAALFFSTLILSANAVGQSHAPPPPIPLYRWIVSFNPFGLLEPPMAIGAGIGYRFNKQFELWSETSLLKNGIAVTPGPVNGIRQIAQLKYFLEKNGVYFLAVEGRYKYYSYRDTGVFINTATHDTMQRVSYSHEHSVFGAGLQLGGRWSLSHNGRLQMELTIGLGIKWKQIIRKGAPADYTNIDYPGPDISVRAISDDKNANFYFPGSLRIIYNFGKRLK